MEIWTADCGDGGRDRRGVKSW